MLGHDPWGEGPGPAHYGQSPIPFPLARADIVRMDQAETPRRAPQAWLDAIARGEADVAAGRTIDFEDVMREFDAEDARLEAEAKARVAGTSRRTASE